MPRTAFFDIDGTLVAPVFQTDDGKTAIGFLSPNWENYCNNHPQDGYQHCVPIEAAINYVRYLRDLGWDTKILTVTMSPGESAAKTAWLEQQQLTHLFSGVISVPSSDKKIPFILEYAKQANIAPNDCMLVEDNMLVMLQAMEEGIRGMHISHIVTGAYDAATD